MCLVILCGCGNREVAQDSTVIETVLNDVPYGTLFGSTEEIIYDVPESLPGVIVDLNGYEPDAEKNVLFCGNELSEVFFVIDAKTEMEVYAGVMKECGIDSDSQKTVYCGSFTEVTTPGTYYICTDKIGRSYDFVIDQDLYQQQLRALCCVLYDMRCGYALENCTHPHDACHTNQSALALENDSYLDVSGGWHTDGQYNKDIVTASGIILNLLMAYELNPNAFTDDFGLEYSGNGVPDILDEIAYETNWMQRMRDSFGGVSGGVVVDNPTDFVNPEMDQGIAVIEEISTEATAAYVTAMARFGGIYKDFNSDYADQCLYYAEQGYRYLSSINITDPQSMQPAIWYMVNAELFKTTGKQVYHIVIKHLISTPENVFLNEDGEGCMEPINPVFWGNYAYITTNRYAKVDICTAIMENIMEEAKCVSEESDASPFLVDTSLYTAKDNMRILDEMQVLTYVNYLITNKEYRTLIQEHMHYLMGRNPQSTNYMTECGIMTSVSDTDYYCIGYQNELYYNSVLILVLSNINNEYEIQN